MNLALKWLWRLAIAFTCFVLGFGLMMGWPGSESLYPVLAGPGVLLGLMLAATGRR